MIKWFVFKETSVSSNDKHDVTMTKELFLIPSPTIRRSQSNYNAINHHIQQTNF